MDTYMDTKTDFSYSNKMRNLLAKTLKIPVKNISIKATTTDHLGYIGKSKGWSVIALSKIYSDDEKSIH